MFMWPAPLSGPMLVADGGPVMLNMSGHVPRARRCHLRDPVHFGCGDIQVAQVREAFISYQSARFWLSVVLL